MDKLCVAQKSPKQANQIKRKKGNKKKEPIKVVYISNPLRVTTTEAEFKGRVQELTGIDSDVADHAGFQPAPPVAAPGSSPSSSAVSDPSRDASVTYHPVEEDVAFEDVFLDGFTGLDLYYADDFRL